jgi:type IV secretion system protein VirB9
MIAFLIGIAAIAGAAPSAPPSAKPVHRQEQPTKQVKEKEKVPVTRRIASARPLHRVVRATHAATMEPAGQGFINAIQVYPYADGMLYRLYASPGRVSDIALQPGETLLSVAAGDTSRWIIGDTASGAGDSKQTHILVKPIISELSTNLVITSDRRTYYLTLASTDGIAMSALSWTYPQDQLFAVHKPAESAQALAPTRAGITPSQLRFDYRIFGDEPAWRPLRVFDDGRQTFIEFPASIAVSEAPPLFLRGSKGEEELVNYRLLGHFYVVDRLFEEAELRLGTKRPQVVHIARNAAGNGS